MHPGPRPAHLAVVQRSSLTGERAMALRRIVDSRSRQRGKDEVIQEFGTVYPVPIGLGENVRSASANALNPLLANTMVLRDLYKKHHWQVSGATFYPLHLLFDKHYNEQVELVDGLAERIVALGGVPLAAPHDVAEASSIARPPKGRESVPAQITRLLDAHEQILVQSRKAAREASENGDDGTNDLIVSDVIRTNEMHVFFLASILPTAIPTVIKRPVEAAPPYWILKGRAPDNFRRFIDRCQCKAAEARRQFP